MPLFHLVTESDDTFAKATLTAAFGNLDEGYEMLDEMEVWPDWPTPSFSHSFKRIWNPQGNDTRYEVTRSRIDQSWGIQSPKNAEDTSP